MKTIDARGLSCPEPVVLLRSAMSTGEDSYQIIVDNHASRENTTRYAQHQGYQVILNEAEPAICAGRLAMVLDQRYFYDRQNYLRSDDRSVRRLFHQLNGAKEELLLVVKQNEPLYAVLLDLL